MLKTLLLTFAATVALAAVSFAQQSTPAETQSQGPKEAHATAQQPSSGVSAVLKIKTRLVVVDVVARDSKGAPVTDLKQEDFTVVEDGKEQKVRIFSFQRPETTPAQTTPSPARPANIVDNLPHFRPGRALNVILMDAINTGAANQMYMRDAMVRFLEKLPDSQPI